MNLRMSIGMLYYQLLTVLERAVNEDYLTSNFETTAELLEAAGVPNIMSPSGLVTVIPSVPNTVAAVAFRLYHLDASMSYMPLQKTDSHRSRDDNGFMVSFKLVFFYLLGRALWLPSSIVN
jgi:hypothetical protein